MSKFESPYENMQDRLLANSVLDPLTGCWNWIGSINHKGYGRLCVRKAGFKHPQPLAAHRVSYEEFKGPIPDGLQLDHICVNRACIAPDHLEPVTLQENIARRCQRRNLHIDTDEDIEYELDQGI